MSMGAIPCSAIAAIWSSRPRIARIPPEIFGCIVLTRPSSISGNPVTSETSRTGMPFSRIIRAVPPVEIISAPSSLRKRAKSMIPVLSVTLMRTRRRGISRTITRCRALQHPRALSCALAAAKLQRIGLFVAPVLVDLGEEFGRLGELASQFTKRLDLVPQNVLPESLACLAIPDVVIQYARHRDRREARRNRLHGEAEPHDALLVITAAEQHLVVRDFFAVDLPGV